MRPPHFISAVIFIFYATFHSTSLAQETVSSRTSNASSTKSSRPDIESLPDSNRSAIRGASSLHSIANEIKKNHTISQKLHHQDLRQTEKSPSTPTEQQILTHHDHIGAQHPPSEENPSRDPTAASNDQSSSPKSDEKEQSDQNEYQQVDDQQQNATQSDSISSEDTTNKQTSLTDDDDVRASRIVQISKLLDYKEDLNDRLLSHRLERAEAVESLHESIFRRDTLEIETRQIRRLRKLIEQRLSRTIAGLPRFDQSMDILTRQANSGHRDIDRLLSQKYWLVQEKRRLITALREKGLEQWVERAIKDSVSPFVADALVEGTASVVEPMLDGIEKLAAVERDFSRRMSVKLGKVPIMQKPFYAGFIAYTVLLCPVVLVVSLLLKLKKSFSKLSVGHAVIIGNFYFLLLSGGCFVATMLGSVDVLQTFRHHNRRFFDFIMFIHGTLFVGHFFLHMLIASRTRDRRPFGHVLLLLSIGLHFFVHSYRHAMRQEDPHVDNLAYFTYTGIFLFLLYEQTVRRLRSAGDKKVMTLNNTSIASPENDIEAGVTASTGRKESQFPTSRTAFLNKQIPHSSTPAVLPRLRAGGTAQSAKKQDLPSLQKACARVTNGTEQVAVTESESTAAKEL